MPVPKDWKCLLTSQTVLNEVKNWTTGLVTQVMASGRSHQGEDNAEVLPQPHCHGYAEMVA